MAKEVMLQVPMDPEDKRKVEELYKGLGTSFEEAVRIFARQSILENGMPFRMAIPSKKECGMVEDEKADGCGLPVESVKVKESATTEIDDSFISGSFSGFSAEMAIEEALSKKHGGEAE